MRSTPCSNFPWWSSNKTWSSLRSQPTWSVVASSCPTRPLASSTRSKWQIWRTSTRDSKCCSRDCTRETSSNSLSISITPRRRRLRCLMNSKTLPLIRYSRSLTLSLRTRSMQFFNALRDSLVLFNHLETIVPILWAWYGKSQPKQWRELWRRTWRISTLTETSLTETSTRCWSRPTSVKT